LSDKTKNIKGNGHINTSNVNGVNSECILLTYTVWNFKTRTQVDKIKKGIEKIVDAEITFDLQLQDYNGLEEVPKLKAKIKSCHKEKEAHTIKATIDEYIRKEGGQTTLDESIGDGE